MAYAAAVSQKDILKQLYCFSDGFQNIHCPKSYLKFLHDISLYVQAIDFEEYNPGAKFLENEIRDALWRAEDIVESYLLTYFLASEDIAQSSRDATHSSNFSQDLLRVMQEIYFGMKKMYVYALYLNICKEYSISFAAASVTSSSHDLSRNKMVGIDWELDNIKRVLFQVITQQCLVAFVLHGMGGIGKTSLTKIVYNDSDVRDHFLFGAWVNISLEFCARDILLSLLHTAEVFGLGKLTSFGLINVAENDTEAALANLVREIFASNRYLVVVDCLCEMNEPIWGFVKALLPDSSNGSRIIVVNRMEFRDDDFVILNYPKFFLDASHSWNLLCEQVFGDEPCPRALERIGKRIARICQGLPLAIITVGVHLAKNEKTVEYWKKVEESGNAIAYAVDGAPMFEQLGLSYKQMPQHLRPIYLYMGAFPESYIIPDSELHSLWLAEGLLEWEQNTNMYLFNYLSKRNLATVMQGAETSVLTYSLHHALWHFCCHKAKEDEFFHVMDQYTDSEDSPQGSIVNNLRRLVIRKNVLFGVIKLKRSVSNIRSLLFTGPYHPYPLRISWGNYKTLKVLNASSIRFFEFPVEILCLALLRYLALTLNGGELPPGISKLRNLQFLIVRFHHIVRSFGRAPSYLPTEIWDMRQLLHLECMGSDLPVPPHSESMLPNLLTLSGVTHHSCTREVLDKIPNLIHLVISIDVAPESVATPFSLFNHLVLPKKLKWLNVVIANPYFEGCPKPHVVAMPESVSVSMYSLTRLTLSGCGFSWKSIKHVSKLPVLGFLKLKCHAFRGPEWKLSNEGFNQLKSLILEDLDLIYWTAKAGDHFFPCLRDLTIIRCHKLQEISPDFVHCHDVIMIRVVDSTTEVETWARTLRVERSRMSRALVLEIYNLRGESNCSTMNARSVM